MKRLVILLTLLLMVTAATSAQDTVTIRFAHIFGGEQDSRVEVIQQIADAFMAQNPNVVIELVSPSTDYIEVFNGALLAAEQGQAPAIVQVEEGLTQLAADSGFFVPVGSVATEEQLASLEDLLPTVRAYFTIDETLYSVPWNVSNPIMYYNKGMFEAAGLDPETPPTTLDEILTACEAIVAANPDLAACMNFPMASWFPEQWVTMQNEVIANNDNGRSARASEMNYTSAAMTNVMNWLKAMDDRGYYVYSGTPSDYNGEGIAFLSKTSAISLNSTAGLTLFQRFSMLQGVQLGVAPLPLPSADATNGVTVGGASLWVTGGLSEAETKAAVDFIFFLTSTENDILWHQGTGYLPTRVSSVEKLTADGWFDENPNFVIAVNQLRNSGDGVANAGAIVGPSAEVRMILIEAMQSIVDGGETVEAALAAAKTRADAVLAEYNALVGE